MNIRIITDSAADFTQQELAAHHIHCVPMTITFGEEAFIDGGGAEPGYFLAAPSRRGNGQNFAAFSGRLSLRV